VTIRKAKLRTEYTQLDNRTVNDRRLSLEALGFLTFCLSKPPTWEIRNDALHKHLGLGEVRRTRILNELQEAGYAIRRRVRHENGRYDWITEIRQHVEDDYGNLIHVSSPHPDNQGMDDPCPDTPGIYKGKTEETGISEEPSGSSPIPKDSETPSSPPRGDGELFGEAGSDQSGTPDIPQKQNGKYPQEFEDFWQAYPRGPQGVEPRRSDKAGTYAKWRSALRKGDVTATDLVLAAQRYHRVRDQDDPPQKYVCIPTKFLGKGRYETYLGDEWEQTKKQLKPPKDDSWRYMV
jgi:hypothetical protein